MGNTYEDAAQEMAELEEAEEAEKKARKAYEHLQRRREQERAAEEAEALRLRDEAFELTVEGLFSNRTDSDLPEFTAYATDLLNKIKKFKHSIPRCVILANLAGMQHYEALVGRDGKSIQTLLSDITEPPDYPIWGPRGKPDNTYSHLIRLRNDGLLEQVEEKIEGSMPGELISGARVLPEGIALSVHHGYLGVEALVECWRTDGGGPQETTNQWALRTANPSEDDSGYQFTTSNDWACLATLQEWDNYIEDRYREKRPHEIAKAFTAAHQQDANKAFQFLDEEHRQHLIEEVLLQSEVGSNHAVFANIVGQIASKRSFEDRIACMVEYYASGNPQGPGEDGQVDIPLTERNASATVDELICRFTWIIVRRLMDRRMNVSAPEVRPSQDSKELSLAALLDYLRTLPEVAGLTVRTQHQNAEGRRPDITIEAELKESFVPDEEEPF